VNFPLRRLVLLVALFTGCATAADQVQRTVEGPRADEIWTARFVRDYGRVPSSDESRSWRDQLDEQIGAYLRAHPDVGTSPRASQFRFQRRAQVGMSVDEVSLLLGAPESRTDDPGTMKTAAGTFWPAVQARAREMWVYPSEWRLYFAEGRLVDITVGGRASLD
jgi:hypothetical protein